MGDNLDTGGNLTGTESMTLRFGIGDGAPVLVGISDCCKCRQPSEDFVLCVQCGNVKR